MRFWRHFIEERAGEDIAALQECLHDQSQFADRTREIIRDLGLAAELDDPGNTDEGAEDSETIDDSSDAESELMPQDVVLDDEQMGEEDIDGESSMMEMDAEMDMSELALRPTPKKHRVLCRMRPATFGLITTMLRSLKTTMRRLRPKSCAMPMNWSGCGLCWINS